MQSNFAKNIKVKTTKNKKNILIFIEDDGPGIPFLNMKMYLNLSIK